VKTPETPRTRWGTVVLVGGTALLVVLLGTAVVAANAWKRDLRVTGVRCEGNSILADSVLVRLAAVPRGVRLYSVDLGAVRKRLRTQPYVRDVVVTRDHPGTVLLEVEERVPVAVIAGDPMLYVDEEGVVLPPARSELLFDLPVLTGALAAEPVRSGARLTGPGAREALTLLAAARGIGEELSRKISEFHLTPEGEVVAYTAEGGVPVAFGKGDGIEKMVKFDAFWRDIVHRRGVHGLEYVDLRYADQVVVRWAGADTSGQQ
jgi:cell division protein FtsQ